MNPINSTVVHPFSVPEIFDQIMSSIPEKNKGGYGRVENMELSLKIISISRKFRIWFCCSEKGPYKFTAIAIKALIGDTPRELRCFLGMLNRELIKPGKIAFDYMDRVLKNGFHGDPLSVYPTEMRVNITNFTNETPLDLLIPTVLHDRPRFEPLLNKLLEQADPPVIAKALNYIFSHSIRYRLEIYLELADHLIAKIELKTGSGELAMQVLQPLIGKILCFSHEDMDAIYGWIKSRGFIFNVDNLSDCFRNEPTDPAMGASWLEIMRENICSEKVVIDKPTKNGDHVIFRVFKLTNGGWKDRGEYLRLILEKDPNSVYAQDKNGLTPLFHLIRNKELVKIIKPFLNETALWKLRLEYQQSLVRNLADYRMKKFIFSSGDLDQEILKYLEIIKELFSSDKKFEEWLVAPWENGKCFLHEIALWSALLIDQMYASDLFSTLLFDQKYGYDYTLRELQGLHEKLATGHPSAEELKVIVQVMPDLIHPSVLYDLCRHVIFFYCGKHESLLESLLEIKGINFTDELGNTLLHRVLAPKYDVYQIASMKTAIAFLMDRGADPTIRNNKGETAQEIAIQNGWESILPMLR